MTKEPEEPEGSGWSTLAKVLVAIGGVIGAVAALVGALAAMGIFSSPPSSEPTEPAVSLQVSPNPQSFGSVQIGHSSAVMTITITNPGKASTAIVTNLEGRDSKDFKVDHDTCRDTIIPSNTSCQVYIEFSPHETGSRIAQLRIGADHAVAPAPVALTGIALAAGSVLFDPPQAFILLTAAGSAPLPTVGTVKLTVINNGPGTLAIKAINVDDPSKRFSVQGDCLNRTLTVKESCTLTVQLKISSTETGLFKANALLVDDASDSPQSIPLSGYRGRFHIPVR